VEEVRADVADMKVESRPVELLTSVGSCVALGLHHPVLKCGGLAQVMLPQSANGSREPLPSKYADSPFKRKLTTSSHELLQRIKDDGHLTTRKAET
jgi:chemotaxis receptor (MCP) glutamine deamidase CheD